MAPPDSATPPPASRREAVRAHRERQRERGVVRFEVQGLEADKGLVRELARKLARGGPEAVELRREIARVAQWTPNEKGSIWRAFRSAPLYGDEIDLTREVVEPRDIDL